jgi:hypothetical protein
MTEAATAGRPFGRSQMPPWIATQTRGKAVRLYNNVIIYRAYCRECSTLPLIPLFGAPVMETKDNCPIFRKQSRARITPGGPAFPLFAQNTGSCALPKLI